MSFSDLFIQDLGPKGDGIHRGPRGLVFVERTAPGDRLMGKVQRDSQGVTRAEVVEILERSPHRQKAPCPHYEACGNCSLQHLEPSYYRQWKMALVGEAFARQGLRPRKWLPPVFVGGATRRRATFTARRQGGKGVLGYYRRRSQDIADIASCLVAEPALLALREKLKAFFPSLVCGSEPLDIFLQALPAGTDLVLTGPVGKTGVPDAAFAETAQRLAATLPVSRVSWRKTETDPAKVLFSKSPLLAAFGPLKVALPPAAFLQPTVGGEIALVAAVMAALPARGRFADLFSGCGTFTGPMTARGSVDAYEAMPAAVSALAKAGGEKVRAFRRDLFRQPLRRDELNRYDAIVFDPPRGGCPEQAEHLAACKSRTLVGVSCNPATFARDARMLCDGGYWLQSLQVVDQFLWSHHVEVVGVFTKQKRN